jgi:hypothetical protein
MPTKTRNSIPQIRASEKKKRKIREHSKLTSLCACGEQLATSIVHKAEAGKTWMRRRKSEATHPNSPISHPSSSPSDSLVLLSSRSIKHGGRGVAAIAAVAPALPGQRPTPLRGPFHSHLPFFFSRRPLSTPPSCHRTARSGSAERC